MIENHAESRTGNHPNQAPVEINRTAINQANSQKSTGPKTEAGKNKTRFNAYRHGLTGKTIVMPWQDRDAYEVFCKKLFAGLKPEGPVEELYAQTVADCSWRLNSAAAREANLLSLAIHERAEAIDSGNEEVDSALAEAQALREESHVLANVSIYCQRIARQRDNALAQLQKLQETRKEQRKSDLHDATRLRKLHTYEEIPFNPTEYGFDFSTPEIDGHIHRESRIRKAYRTVG